jgi:NAD(P)-dependent dehydrogenase (short-subunit alcohol dehydrogenase family)
MINTFWRKAKIYRKIPIGPISLVYGFRRTTKVSNNARRRLRRFLGSSISFRNNGNGRAHSDGPTLQSPYRDAQLQYLEPETALIVGVGPGFGVAVARKLAASGMNLALASRNAERLDPLVADLSKTTQGTVRAYGCDATDERSVEELMSLVARDMGVPHLVIYSVQGFDLTRSVVDIDVPAFEECWRQNCLGGFLVAREAARRMLTVHRGTIILVGSTSGILARAGHLNLAVGKFGLRAIAHVMARELCPSQIHVVHLIIDADIKEEPVEADEPQALPEDISELVYVLHKQPRSSWTSELDVRPWNEKFWEHC